MQCFRHIPTLVLVHTYILLSCRQRISTCPHSQQLKWSSSDCFIGVPQCQLMEIASWSLICSKMNTATAEICRNSVKFHYYASPLANRCASIVAWSLAWLNLRQSKLFAVLGEARRGCFYGAVFTCSILQQCCGCFHMRFKCEGTMTRLDYDAY